MGLRQSLTQAQPGFLDVLAGKPVRAHQGFIIHFGGIAAGVTTYQVRDNADQRVIFELTFPVLGAVTSLVIVEFDLLGAPCHSGLRLGSIPGSPIVFGQSVITLAYEAA